MAIILQNRTERTASSYEVQLSLLRSVRVTILCLLLPSFAFASQSLLYLERDGKRLFRGQEVANGIGNLTYDAFYDILINKKPSSIEDLLFLIDQRFPYQFYFSTAMHTSLSLHESSYANPRIIVYGPLGDFVFSFNGDTSQRGGFAIEAYEFKPRGLRFREIKFGEAKDEPDIKFVERERSFAISEANPKRCTQCHSDVPHPIWASYPFWPGAYGSEDDMIATAGVPFPSNRLLKIKQTVDLEGFEYDQFVKRQQAHPRYKYFVKSHLSDYLPYGKFSTDGYSTTDGPPDSDTNLYLFETVSRSLKNTYFTEIVFHQVAELFIDQLLRRVPRRQLTDLLSFVRRCQFTEAQRRHYHSLAKSYALAKLEEHIANGDRICSDKGIDYLPGARGGFYKDDGAEFAASSIFPLIVFGEQNKVRFSSYSPTLPNMPSGFVAPLTGLEVRLENILQERLDKFHDQKRRERTCHELSTVLGFHAN